MKRILALALVVTLVTLGVPTSSFAGPRLGSSTHGDVEPGAEGERLPVRQGTHRPGVLPHLQAGRPPAVAEGRTADVGLELPLEAPDVAEGLPERRVLYLIWKEPWMTVSADTYIARMLAKIRWRIEHDYRELKTGLGLG